MDLRRSSQTVLTTVLVCLAVCTVPVLAQLVNVGSLSVSFNDDSNQIREASPSHQFDFDLTINLDAGGDANEGGNLDRWRLALDVQDGNGVQCASATVALTPAQAGVAIPGGGQGTLSSVTATVDLSGCQCSEATQLAVILTSASYTLSGPTQATPAITCLGIVGKTLTLMSNGASLVENAESQTVTLQVIANSESQGRSVICTSNCWAVSVYVATGTISSSTAISSTMVTATVPSGSSSWVAGDTLTLSGITATLNLNGVGSCESIDLLCTSLTRNPASDPDFTIEGTKIDSCTPVVCIGVLINQIIPAFTRPTAIKQGEDNTGLQLTVTIKGDDTKASIAGTDLWRANVFGNADADCLNPTQVPGTVSLTQAADYGLNVEFESVWPRIDVTLNMAQHGCNDAKYICLEVLKGSNPSPDFSLSFYPESAKYGTILVSCTGLTVDRGNLDVNAATQLAAFKEDHIIQFDATFISESTSGGVGGTDLWELLVFPAFNSDGTGTKGPETTVPLDSSHLNTGFPGSGGSLVLSGLVATISLVGDACGTYRYLCARLTKNIMASPDFTIYEPSPYPYVCSALLDCRDVILTSTTVTASSGQSPNGLPLYEGVSRQDIYFDVVMDSDQTAGSVPSGTDHWEFVVNPGGVTAELTQAQQDKELTAGEELSFTRVQATLDLTSTRCVALGDVCAEVMRSADDTLNFRLGSSSAQNTGCFTPTCEGVEITSLIISDGVVNFDLKEGEQDHSLTFSVEVTSNADAGSVRGANLWKMLVFLSRDSTNPGLVEADAVLGAWASRDVLAGVDTTLEDIQVMLDLDTTCTNMRFLCIQLARADGQTFLLAQPADTLRTCKPVPQCNGIEVDSTAVALRSGNTLVEGVSSNTPVVEVSLTFTDTSASVTGSDIWRVTMYGSSSADGSGTRIEEQTSTTSGNSVAGTTVELNGITWNVDMTSLLCIEVTHVCVEVTLEASADFTLVPQVNHACSPADCEGIVIISEDFTFVASVIYEATQPQVLTTSTIFAQAASNGASIQDNVARIWEVSLYLNAANDGSGQTFATATALLSDAQQRQGVDSNSPLTFNTPLPFQFTLDVMCGDALYVCLEIAERDNVSPNYDITFPELPTCKEVNCIGVVFTSANLSVPADTVLIENEDSHLVTVTFSADTAPVTATLQTGSNFWRLSVFGNTEPDGSGAQRYGESPAILTAGQRTTQALADDTVELAGVTASLSLDDFVCPADTVYLCAELQRDPMSRPPFTIQGAPKPLVACQLVECQGVLITSIDIAGLPPAVVENEVNSLVLEVTVGVGGADASGTNLWRMNASLVSDGVVLASEEINLGAQASADVMAGVPVTFSNLNVPFDLRGLVCPSNGSVMLCLELSRGGSADTDFTVTGLTKKCVSLPCLGVVIVNSNVRASTGSLVEGRSNNDITLSVSYWSKADGASISGTGLWSITVYGNDRESGLGTRMGQTTGNLQGNGANFPLAKGGVVDFNGVTARLDLSPYLVCEEVRWVCAELTMGGSADPDFSLWDVNNARIACTSLDCTGVQIASTTLTIDPSEVTEDSGDQAVTLTSIRLVGGPGSSTLQNHERNFKVVIFGNSMEDTSGPEVAKALADISSSLNFDITPGLTTELIGKASLNLTGVFCGDLQYLCVRVYRGDMARQKFKLEGVPNDNSLIDCQEVTCKGLRVTGATVATSSVLLEGNPSYPVEITMAFNTDASGASIRPGGTDLFRVVAFLAGTMDGGDPTTAEQNVTLPQGSESQPVDAGTSISFTDAEALLDTTGWTCQPDNFVCVRLMKDPQASFNYVLEGWDDGNMAVDNTLLQRCAPITCRGVNITDVIFRNVEPLSFQERDPSTDFLLDLGLVADPQAGGVVGTGLWKLTFSLSGALDGAGTEFGTEVEATLSEENLDRGVDPLGPTTNLTDVNVTLPGVGSVLCSRATDFYLCVQVEKKEGSSPDFTLAPVEKSCTMITCYPVRIREVSFEVTTPSFIRENQENALHVDLTVNVHELSADISGMGLWDSPSFEVRNAANTLVLASTGGYWGLAEQNKGLSAGETEEFVNIFPVTVTPNGLLCDQIKKLCMTFAKGPIPDPDFGIEFLLPAEVCVDVDCRGVEIISTVISDITSGGTITERATTGQDITLTVTSASSADAAGISGTRLWGLRFYYTPSANGHIDGPIGSTAADLTPAQENMDLVAGEDLVFQSAMKTSFDVSNLVCPEGQLWLCARLEMHGNPSPLFTLSGQGGDLAALRGCKNITCIGVEIEETDLLISQGMLIPVEKASSHDIEFIFESTPSARSATISGTGLWRLKAFANRRADGTHFRRSYETDVALTAQQMNTGITFPGVVLSFSGLAVNLNLQGTDTECRETPFFCGELLKGANPSPEFSLQGEPDESVLTNCQPLDCNGVKIATFGLTNTGGSILRENEGDQAFSFDVSLTSDANKDSVSGDNLWKFRAFLNDAADCLGDAVVGGVALGEVALTNANVRPGQEDQDLGAGVTIDFDVDVSLDYLMKCPAWDNVYMCLEVFIGDSSTQAFTLFGDIRNGAEIECRGVEVTSTVIYTVNEGSLIVESDNSVTFDLTLRASTEREGSSIAGTGLWVVDIFVSDTESCQTASTDRVASALSPVNRDKPVTAGGVLTLSGVRATILLRDALCEDLNYVCAELAMGPNPSPDFTLVPKPDGTALLAAKAIDCKGLHILSSRLTLTEGEPLISNQPQHPVAFNFVFETDPTGASVLNPTDLFRLQVAATASPDRAGVVASEHQVTLPYSPDANFNILAGQTIYLQVEAELNLRGARCEEIPYICMTLMKGLNPLPLFTLTPDSDDPALTACSERLDCYGVRVVAEALTITSGIPFKEHADSNPVELTVSLTADDMSGNAVGNDLWSAEVKLSRDNPAAPGTEFLAATAGTFVGSDASQDLERGQTVQLRLTANLNLTGIPCSDVRYLVVNITNPDADPEFTLEWRADGPEHVVVSKLFTCSGVSLQTNSLDVDFMPQPLLELASSQEVTFAVSVRVTPDSATVTGQDLWKVTAFVSSDPNGEGTPEDEKEEADLTDAQGRVAITANGVSTLSDVEVTLATAGKYCTDMTYLCVEVWRGDSAQPYYNIESPAEQADLRLCVATLCNGVQIEKLVLTIATEAPLIEMRPNQVVSVDVNVTAAPKSAGIEGDDLWAASVFVSSQPDGSGPKYSVREAIVDPSQSDKDLDPGSVLTLEDLVATMDFTGIPCSQMEYLCVTLQENDQAQPDFNFGQDSNLTSCIETNCISVAIESGWLTLVSNEALEGDDLATFSLDTAFLPWPNSRSLQEADSWALYAYTTDRGDGTGTAFTFGQVMLTDAQQDQAVAVGTPLAFDGRSVTLDLSSQTCATTTHLCVVLDIQDGLSFTLGGYPTRESLVACAELLCSPKEVELFATDVTESRIQVGFTEAFGDFDLYVLTYAPSDGITTSPYSIPRNLPRSLNFDQLVAGKEYTIQLTLRDGADQKAGPFTLLQRTRPDSVDLQLDSVTSSELSVSWDMADGIFDRYTVVLEPSDNGLPRTPLDVYPSQEREVTFTGLLSARQYNVTISTISGSSSSLPSSVITNTDPSTPQLRSTGTGETTVDLTWFINGGHSVDQFEIRYQPADATPQPLLYPQGADSATLEGLVPGRMYTISLVAVSNIGGLVEIRSSPDEVSVQTRPVPPAEIDYEDPGETSVQITWPSAVGEVDYYTVVFTPSADLEETVVTKNNPRELLYQGLEVASEYMVAITTHVNGENGVLVSRPIQRTVYTLPNPPRALAIVQVTTTTIEFVWQDAVGPRDGYEVTFDPSEPEFSPQSPYFTTGNMLLLTGIKPHVTVNFEVRTKIGSVVSRPGVLRQRTFPTKPGKVRDFQLDGIDTDNILISFKVPESPNGLILAYLVTVEGTKPGEPNEAAFQTITAQPNDVQFEEVISPLKAGYTYTLSIQATNTEGTGEPVELSPVKLPIRAPYYAGGQIVIGDFVLDVTSSTIIIRIPRSMFSDRNGKITVYTILVVENGANLTADAILPSYQQVRNVAIKPVYQTAEPFDLFDPADNNGRRRRQTADTADFVIGEEATCDNFGYCNGALSPVTQYRVSLRAFTENGLHTDSPWSDIITTEFDPWWFVYAFIPFIIIILIIAFIMCLCTCIARDRQMKPKRRQPPREKEAIAIQQGNENASNNVLATSVSQEPLTPATPPPKRSPTSRPVALAKFGQHVRKMSAKTGDNFAKEYQDLNLLGDTEAKTVGSLPQNEDKNRYGNIIPFDFNRIRLNKENDYINASLMSGYSGDSEYIATQGPQANSVNNFWQMVWEQNVPVIAAIGSCVEKGRVKFAQYWPSNSTPITFGDVTVNRVSEREETELGYIVRDLCLESGSEVRALRQFQFTVWPLHGVPKKSDQILHFVRTVRTYLPQNAGPLVVHCGAGIGRTGVFIVLDVLTQHLALDEDYIDVFGTVATKREERTNTVQTELQYEFVHRALLDILEGRVTGPNWMLKSKRRSSVDSDQRVENTMAEASL